MSQPARPAPTTKALIDEVAGDVRPGNGALAAWFDQYAAANRHRLAEDLELVERRVDPRASILEVGSVPLLLTGALKVRGFDVTGVDIDPSRFADAIARRCLTVRRCDIEHERLPFADESFDCVLFNELFEHLRFNPPRTIAEVLRVLRADGLLMLSTPNLYSYRGLINLLLRQRAWVAGADPFVEFAKLENLGHMGHVREYTLRELSDLLSRCGFDVVEVVHRGTASSHLERLVTWIRPTLLPYVSVLARRGPVSG